MSRRRARRPGGPSPVHPTQEECFALWSEAVASEDGEYVLAVVRMAGSDAERDMDLGLRWMRAALLLRDVQAVDDDAACFLLNRVLDGLMVQHVDRDPELREHGAELRRIERAHRLAEDEYFLLDEAPPDWIEINTRWDRRFDAIRAEVLRSLGEDELARMLVLFPDEFEARDAAGRETLIGE